MPEPITVMIFVMRASAALGAFILAKALPEPLAGLCSFAAHVMAIMTALVVFGHAEKTIAGTVVGWVQRVRDFSPTLPPGESWPPR